jgi:hypothetical protein
MLWHTDLTAQRTTLRRPAMPFVGRPEDNSSTKPGRWHE